MTRNDAVNVLIRSGGGIMRGDRKQLD